MSRDDTQIPREVLRLAEDEKNVKGKRMKDVKWGHGGRARTRFMHQCDPEARQGARTELPVFPRAGPDGGWSSASKAGG